MGVMEESNHDGAGLGSPCMAAKAEAYFVSSPRIVPLVSMLTLRLAMSPCIVTTQLCNVCPTHI